MVLHASVYDTHWVFPSEGMLCSSALLGRFVWLHEKWFQFVFQLLCLVHEILNAYASECVTLGCLLSVTNCRPEWIWLSVKFSIQHFLERYIARPILDVLMA